MGSWGILALALLAAWAVVLGIDRLFKPAGWRLFPRFRWFGMVAVTIYAVVSAASALAESLGYSLATLTIIAAVAGLLVYYAGIPLLRLLLGKIR